MTPPYIGLRYEVNSEPPDYKSFDIVNFPAPKNSGDNKDRPVLIWKILENDEMVFVPITTTERKDCITDFIINPKIKPYTRTNLRGISFLRFGNTFQASKKFIRDLKGKITNSSDLIDFVNSIDLLKNNVLLQPDLN